MKHARYRDKAYRTNGESRKTARGSSESSFTAASVLNEVFQKWAGDLTSAPRQPIGLPACWLAALSPREDSERS
ncbi:hypothetical protein BB560_006926 [Smittium megazygosporum]|uniref:Uncharacterized protein n=1 Tax=Smittium megazygosporum TaxID=133381 RepID=A0A2T9Y059_9FUNG|nr:hypothetical protein BB560_006926 [Smittium megazygosporum]